MKQDLISIRELSLSCHLCKARVAGIVGPASSCPQRSCGRRAGRDSASRGLNSINLIDKIRTFLINVARYSTTQLRRHGSNGIISLFFRGIDELSIELFHTADSGEPGCARQTPEIVVSQRLQRRIGRHIPLCRIILGVICPNLVQNI